MTARCAVAACLALAACAAAPPAPDRAAQEAACDRVVAEHVGAAQEAVTTTWLEATAGGGAVFEARDGERLHTCDVDAAARVLRLDHPGAESG